MAEGILSTSLPLMFGAYTVSSCYLENNVPDKPPEDAIPIAEIVNDCLAIGVADGVTLIRQADGSYPNPSQARRAADAGLGEALACVHRGLRFHAPSIRLIYDSIHNPIGAVGKVNMRLGLTDQNVDNRVVPAGTTLTFILLVKNGDGHQLLWGHIGDSCLLIQEKNGTARRITSAQTANKDLMEAELRMRFGENFDLERWDLFFRREFWNNRNASATIGGQEIPTGIGVLTGDERAVDFIEIGVEDIHPGTSILLFTDGAVMGFPRIEEILSTYPPAKVLPVMFREAAEIQERRGLPNDDMSGVSVIFTG